MEKNKLVIPNGREEILEREFYNNRDINEVEFPSSLKIIKPFAFKYCDGVTVFDLPNGVERIEAEAFNNCQAKIFIPKSIKYIGKEAFGNGCEVYFEGKENGFIGFYDFYYEADYPDSYYRGPSMGQEKREFYFYSPRTKMHYEVSHEDFLKLIK